MSYDDLKVHWVSQGYKTTSTYDLYENACLLKWKELKFE